MFGGGWNTRSDGNSNVSDARMQGKMAWEDYFMAVCLSEPRAVMPSSSVSCMIP